MKRKEYLLLLFVVIIAFWQVFFLKYGMKWDFTDAFLPSRYFFSESILNNQFPLWNPYLLYGIPVYADLVSVFNPEFWIVGNMFGYNNISLQFIFLAYVFIAGISFFYFLKQFNAEYKISVGLAVAYMLSGLTTGNAQHLAFVYGYAILPFVLVCYFKFIQELNKPNLVRLSIALFIAIFGAYPGLTIILGYFLFFIFLSFIAINRADKTYIKKLIIYHLILALIVVLFSSVLIVAYFQGAPFLSRYGGLPLDSAQKHSFTVKSVLSLLLPMATGNDPLYFETDTSMSNGYWGLVSLVFFILAITKKAQNKTSYIILFFGIFSFLASLGDQFFLRKFLYQFAPLMDMFRYPSIFRAFTIFSFLAFAGINLKLDKLTRFDRKRLFIISGLAISVLVILIVQAGIQAEGFAFFRAGKSFAEELANSTRFHNIILQGIIQVFILLVFIIITRKVRDVRNCSTAILFLFVFDGIISTQLNIHYTVIGDTNPVKFYNYLKSSPKGFPVPELNPIGENSDRNAQNDFIWMNNNVFQKKITFDGLISFRLDGYAYLADNHPDLLDAIKREAVVYFSDDVRVNSHIENFKTNTLFISASDFEYLKEKDFRSGKNDKLAIQDFSPAKIEIETSTSYPRLLTYQQNYFDGWNVYIDGVEQKMIKSNFAHMSVCVPPGTHTVVFKYTNPVIKYAFCFSYLVFFILVAFSVHFYIIRHPEKKKRVIVFLTGSVLLFIAGSGLNRYLYQKNKLGLTPEIMEKVEHWKKEYNNKVSILLSSHQKGLKNLEYADTTFFVDEKTNLPALSHFLMNLENKYFAFAWQGGIVNDDIFELIYSFYPAIIEQEKTNNSGFMLVEKGEEQQNYVLQRNFEPDGSPGWNRDGRIIADSVSDNHTYFYNENNEWGTTIELPVGKNLLSLKKITILSDFMFEKNIAETLLVFTTARAGETHLYHVSKIDKFALNPGQWGRVAFCVELESDLHEGDLIKIYFWNINKARFHIDNMKLKFSHSE